MSNHRFYINYYLRQEPMNPVSPHRGLINKTVLCCFTTPSLDFNVISLLDENRVIITRLRKYALGAQDACDIKCCSPLLSWPPSKSYQLSRTFQYLRTILPENLSRDQPQI